MVKLYCDTGGIAIRRMLKSRCYELLLPISKSDAHVGSQSNPDTEKHKEKAGNMPNSCTHKIVHDWSRYFL